MAVDSHSVYPSYIGNYERPSYLDQYARFLLYRPVASAECTGATHSRSAQKPCLHSGK